MLKNVVIHFLSFFLSIETDFEARGAEWNV